ncbi:MAG TPA: response regulator [Terracidiphilus sp.]|nr:response regulator [Terracidiphilus sp.]
MSKETESEKPIHQTVFIVDDDPSIREGLVNLLESVRVPARSYPTAEAFEKEWNPANAGCLLLDARLPGISGVEFQEQLQKSGIALPVIFMTAHGDVPMVRKVMKAGAVEFLVKPFQKEELLQAVEQAFALDRARRKADDIMTTVHARFEALTERERQVMELVTAGMTNKEIADRLCLSIVTVKLHRGQMMRKMQASSLADLVKMSEKLQESRTASENRD